MSKGSFLVSRKVLEDTGVFSVVTPYLYEDMGGFLAGRYEIECEHVETGEAFTVTSYTVTDDLMLPDYIARVSYEDVLSSPGVVSIKPILTTSNDAQEKVMKPEFFILTSDFGLESLGLHDDESQAIEAADAEYDGQYISVLSIEKIQGLTVDFAAAIENNLNSIPFTLMQSSTLISAGQKHSDLIYSDTWDVSDIVAVGEERGYELTEDEAKEVLAAVRGNHDVNNGITWDSVTSDIETFISQRRANGPK